MNNNNNNNSSGNSNNSSNNSGGLSRTMSGGTKRLASEAPEEISSDVTITLNDWERRKEFVGFTKDDEEILSELHLVARTYADDVMIELYNRWLAFPEIRFGFIHIMTTMTTTTIDSSIYSSLQINQSINQSININQSIQSHQYNSNSTIQSIDQQCIQKLFQVSWGTG